VARRDFHSSFVRAGERRKIPTSTTSKRTLLEFANDWKLLVDYDHKKITFPPIIVATDLRPDIILWSVRSRTVILLELTCPAEEGIAAAQVRKQSRYQSLVQDINETKSWKARLLTLEVGARGLVGSTTYHAFRLLGFSASQTKSLVKGLSEVVVRCSYAIYLAHSVPVWPHNDDLVCSRLPRSVVANAPTPKIVVLRNQGIRYLYHFTDSDNLPSIKKSGLMSASELLSAAVPSKMNSDETSRKLDTKANLGHFVRLSFCAKNPMMFVAKKEGRISNPVILRIKLEAVSRPGVMFSDCNATRHDAIISERPDVIRFDVVKAKSCFAVPELLRHYYQAEILIPSPLPPHLITFPRVNRVPKGGTLGLFVNYN
jgi:hypothetical protein